MMQVRFWGVRGSIPTPITGADVEAKVAEAYLRMAQDANRPPDGASTDEVKAWMQANLPFHLRSTVGGNTTCIEVRCGKHLIILDMGTGMRPLGNSLFPEIFKEKGITGTIFQSHVHWDHIQGFPFFGPLFMSRRKFDNRFTFHGGKEWERDLQSVLGGQMEAPVFPVDLHEIAKVAMHMDFDDVWSGKEFTIGEGDDQVHVQCLKLHHPQETFGYRIRYRGFVLAWTTDHEPYGDDGITDELNELVADADVWITDCQYSLHQYHGDPKHGNVKRYGWGHSYPQFTAKVGQKAKPKMIVNFHHDPASSDLTVADLATQVNTLSGIPTVYAYEGLTLTVG